jgi:predicted PurR-regulated permease PerM
MADEKILDISWKTILKVSITVICFYLFFAIKDTLILFVFALAISTLFNPAVNFFQKRGIPRFLGIIFVYFSIFSLFAYSVYLTVPLFSSEINQFLKLFPQYFEKISPPLRGLGFQAFENINSFIQGVSSVLEKMADNIFNVLFAVFGGFFSFLFIISIAFFLSLEEKAAEKTLTLLFPKKYEAYILNLWERCEREIAGWFGARILACLFVGLATYISLLIFNVRYPAVLALFAGIFNFIPYIGPLVTGFLFFIIIFPTEALKAVFVIIVFTIIQQIENSVLSPLLMKKIIGVPPSVVLISLIVGAKLWGLLGALLAVPLFGILFEFMKEFLQKRRDKEAVEL